MKPEDKYISVNEFKETLAGLVVEGGSEAVRSAIAKTLSDAVPQFLDNEPAADVQPVKHGEWKINSDGYYPYCSACGTAADQLTKHLTKYCPECGARMDGKKATLKERCSNYNECYGSCFIDDAPCKYGGDIEKCVRGDSK